MGDTPTKKFSFGTCAYKKTAPALSEITPQTKVLNLTMSFEEALKLNVAIDECVRRLNSYKRSTTKGKKTALNLAVHLDQERVSVNVGTL